MSLSSGNVVRHDSRGGLITTLSRAYARRALLFELTRRDLEDSYAGSALFRVWALLHPLLVIALYVFVFGYVFTTRLGADLPSTSDSAVYMLSGLSAWLAIQASLSKSSASLVASANLVKQVVFPIELLPLRSVLAAQMPLLIGIAVVTLYSLVKFGFVSPLLPLVMFVTIAQGMLLAGIGLFLSALTVYVRDTRDLVQFFSTFGIFLVPAVFLPGSLPGWFETILYFNPFSYAVWCLQDVFFFHRFAHPAAWLVLGILGLGALHLGSRFFESVRSGFGDVL